MRISAVAFLMILTTVFLSACEQKSSAVVENRGSNYYGRGAVQSFASNNGYQVGTSSGSQSFQQSDAAVMEVASRDLGTPQKTAVQSTPTSYVKLAPAGQWQWPVQGKVTQQFGLQKDGTRSQGITIAANEGAPIRAAQSGEVAFVGENIRDYGTMVIVRHKDGTLTSYSHAQKIAVKKGDKVVGGSVIAYVGKTGSAKTPQLHFAMRQGAASVDPLGKLPHTLASN